MRVMATVLLLHTLNMSAFIKGLSVCVCNAYVVLCMYVCMRAPVCVCVFACMYMSVTVCLCGCMHVCVCACARTLAQTLLHAYAFVSMSFCAVSTVQITMVYSQ